MVRGLRQARTGFARVLAALALVAMAVRALVPAGYMLAPVSDGSLVAIVLCSGHEAVLDLSTGQLVDPGQPLRGGDDSKNDAPCVFAVATQMGAPETASQTPPLRAASKAPTHARAIAPGRGLAAPPPWATGPPLIA